MGGRGTEKTQTHESCFVDVVFLSIHHLKSISKAHLLSRQ